MDPYSTHVPILAWVVQNTRGPILELGCGFYSTPLLHLLAPDRKILSLETDKQYVDKLQKFASPEHRIEHVPTWENIAAFDQEWDVAFVDNAPGAARGPCIRNLKDRAKYIVVHDSDLPAYYGLAPVLPLFRYSVCCKWFPKWTTVLSMSEPLDDLEGLL